MKYLLGILLLLSLVVAQAQTTLPVPSEVVSIMGSSASIDCTNVSLMPGSPPTFALIPKSSGARDGYVWVNSGLNGLCVVGMVNGGAPDWPVKPTEMLSKDHVEVWLATTPDITLPPVGYGNQFGETGLKSADDCEASGENASEIQKKEANCRAWYTKQTLYRALLRRLFVRQWAIANAGIEEEFATTAWRNLETNFFRKDLPEQLQPREFDGTTTLVHDGKAGNGKFEADYTFQLFIPYSALPPSPSLEIRDLWLMVDVFSPASNGAKTGPFSTTSAQRVWGDPSTFSHIRLQRPVKYTLSPCGDPLIEKNIYEDKLAAWFLPVEPEKASQGPTLVDKDFILTNPASGYMYDPGGVSPRVEKYTHYWKQVGADNWVCGPNLATRRGSVTAASMSLAQDTRFSDGDTFRLNEETMDAKMLPDVSILVKSGPYATTRSPFGSGACGGCTTANLNFFTISPNGEMAAALKLELLTGDALLAVDFDIAADWKRLTVYEQVANDPSNLSVEDSHWDSTAYCLNGKIYEKCGEAGNVKPPDPPKYPEFRAEQ
jgi:hypothetical protein